MDIKIEYDGRDYLVKAESGVREMLMAEGVTILGTVQKDSVVGAYFVVGFKQGMKAAPFKDTILRKPPLSRERW